MDPVNVYFWKNNYSSSFNFYTATSVNLIDSIFKGKKPIWLFDNNDSAEVTSPAISWIDHLVAILK
jgi:hypothetical protein